MGAQCFRGGKDGKGPTLADADGPSPTAAEEFDACSTSPKANRKRASGSNRKRNNRKKGTSRAAPFSPNSQAKQLQWCVWNELDQVCCCCCCCQVTNREALHVLQADELNLLQLAQFYRQLTAQEQHIRDQDLADEEEVTITCPQHSPRHTAR